MFFLLSLLSIQISIAAASESLPTFATIWKAVQGRSSAIQSDLHHVASKKVALSRISRHWLPTLFLDSKIYQTQEPGLSLFSKLSSQGLTGADLSPFAMNYPDLQVFESLSFNAELVLFAGGAKEAERLFFKKELESAQALALHNQTQVFSNTARLYGNLLISEPSIQELRQTRSLLQNTIERYQIGAKANPVGYSGLLSLKILHKRIEAILLQLQSSQTNSLRGLETLSGLSLSSSPPQQSLSAWLQDLFRRSQTPKNSSLINATLQGAQALEELSAGEKAHYLPKIGLFGQSNYTFSPDSGGQSYTFGAYLQWSLFSPTHWEASREKQLSAASYFARAYELQTQQKIENDTLLNEVQTLHSQVDLLIQSSELMNEQLQISQRLFRSGAIQALQLSEAFHKKIELIEQKIQLEGNLLKARLSSLAYLSEENQKQMVNE